MACLRSGLAASAGLMALLMASQAGAQTYSNPLFGRGDTNHDGVITRAELQAGTNAEFRRLDINHDGVLTAADEPHAASEGMRTSLRRVAAEMDTNHDRQISREEFVAGRMRMFDVADADHDGRVTRAEGDAAVARFRAGGGGAQ